MHLLFLFDIYVHMFTACECILTLILCDNQGNVSLRRTNIWKSSVLSAIIFKQNYHLNDVNSLVLWKCLNLRNVSIIQLTVSSASTFLTCYFSFFRSQNEFHSQSRISIDLVLYEKLHFHCLISEHMFFTRYFHHFFLLITLRRRDEMHCLYDIPTCFTEILHK